MCYVYLPVKVVGYNSEYVLMCQNALADKYLEVFAVEYIELNGRHINN